MDAIHSYLVQVHNGCSIKEISAGSVCNARVDRRQSCYFFLASFENICCKRIYFITWRWWTDNQNIRRVTLSAVYVIRFSAIVWTMEAEYPAEPALVTQRYGVIKGILSGSTRRYDQIVRAEGLASLSTRVAWYYAIFR